MKVDTVKRDSTVRALRLLADAIEQEKVSFVRSDILKERVIEPWPYHRPARLSLFVEVGT